MTKYSEQQKADAIALIKRFAPEGSIVWFTVEQETRKYQHVKFFSVHTGEPLLVSWPIAVILGVPYKEHTGAVRLRKAESAPYEAVMAASGAAYNLDFSIRAKRL